MREYTKNRLKISLIRLGIYTILLIILHLTLDFFLISQDVRYRITIIFLFFNAGIFAIFSAYNNLKESE